MYNAWIYSTIHQIWNLVQCGHNPTPNIFGDSPTGQSAQLSRALLCSVVVGTGPPLLQSWFQTACQSSCDLRKKTPRYLDFVYYPTTLSKYPPSSCHRNINNEYCCPSCFIHISNCYKTFFDCNVVVLVLCLVWLHPLCNSLRLSWVMWRFAKYLDQIGNLLCFYTIKD